MTTNRLSNEGTTDKFIMPNPVDTVKPSELKASYDSINDYMESIEHYTPINIDNIIAEFHVPEDRKLRYIFFLKISKYVIGMVRSYSVKPW